MIALYWDRTVWSIIESPLVKIPYMGSALGLDRKLFLKQDSELPISGSVKAQGDIYEVLKFAEKIAFENNMLGRT